ncbi:MAG: hypothetical protein L3J52_01555 [Proteobacteria bacterium]|nr:hypothetical protein [Pseudomonadota bacterium]
MRLSLVIFLISVSAVSIGVPIYAGIVIDFTPHGTQPGLNFGIDGASNCGNCHKGSTAGSDTEFMPYASWSGSMMANASRDPLFWAALDVANNDIPGIGDFCLRCHTPVGWYGGRVAKTGNIGAPNIDGTDGCELTGYHDQSDNKANDYQGITCHFCHRQEEQGPSGEPLITNNGNLWVDDLACDNPDANGFTPCRKGPYKYPDTGTVSAPPHDWEFSAFISDGDFCGSCHDVSSPEIDNNGTLEIARKLWHNGSETNVAMPIERTYSEWKNSRFGDLIYRNGYDDFSANEFPLLTKGESCQECHMPNSSSSDARACVFEPGGSRTNDMKVHEFAGGNTWIPQVIKNIYGASIEANNDPGRVVAYDRTTAYAENMLQNHSAIIETSLSSQNATQLDISVKITNMTGHKLPTGYPEGRRMWINVVAEDSSNTLFWESGAYDVGTAILTEDTQVKIYETLQGIWDVGLNQCVTEDVGGNKLFHFVLNNCIAKDNRIPPVGFAGGSNIEMMPVGITYPAHPDNPNELVNFDVTAYQIPITGVSLPITVTATLKYQTSSKDYIEFLETQAVDNSTPTENIMCNRSNTIGPADQSRGAFMKDLWTTYGKSAPVDMVSDNLVIQP